MIGDVMAIQLSVDSGWVYLNVRYVPLEAEYSVFLYMSSLTRDGHLSVHIMAAVLKFPVDVTVTKFLSHPF